jgi:hypothetical protein
MSDVESETRPCEICETIDCGPLYDGIGRDCWIEALIEGVDGFEFLPGPLYTEIAQRTYTVTGLNEADRASCGAVKLCDHIQALIKEVADASAEQQLQDMMRLVLNVDVGGTVELRINNERVATIVRDA